MKLRTEAVIYCPSTLALLEALINLPLTCLKSRPIWLLIVVIVFVVRR